MTLAAAIPTTIPRTALVTGGGKRLGRAISLALAQAGFDVAVHYNTGPRAAEDTCAEIASLGRRGLMLDADLGSEDAVHDLFSRARHSLGAIGVLVNNASVFERDEVDSATRESWDQHIEPNLRAPFVLTQHFARCLPADKDGVILNMLDQRVWSLTPHFVSYTISKAGLWALTQAMALALAPRIRVNAIGPGPALPSPRQTQAQFDRQANSVPLRHGTSPDEVARAALAILAMPAMTGQMIALDGGQHLQWSPTGNLPPMDE